MFCQIFSLNKVERGNTTIRFSVYPVMDTVLLPLAGAQFFSDHGQTG